MSIHRLSMIGALLLLGACAGKPRPQPAAPPVVVAPMQAPAPPSPPPAPAAAPIVAAPSTAVANAVPAPAPMAATPVARPPQAVRPVARPAEHRMPMSRTIAANPAPPVVALAAAKAGIRGHVVLAGSRGEQVAAGEQVDTLVYFVPATGGLAARPGQYTVYTHNRAFSPEAMAVPEGSTVTFVNLDDVRHNVFSVTPGSSFDLGYQGAGEKASHVFARPGVVLVSCHVHRAMELDMLVVPTRYVGRVAADGSFDLRGLPAGPGTLHLWNPRAQPLSQAVTLPLAGTLTLKMLATRPRMTTQFNTGGTP